MSKYKHIRTQLKDRDTVLAALAACEIPHEVAAPDKKLTLRDWNGRTAGKAEIVVRRDVLDARTGGIGNDMGFTWDEAAQCYEVNVAVEHEPALNQIKQEYAVQQVTALAEQQGYTVEPVEAEGGVVRLQLARWA